MTHPSWQPIETAPRDDEILAIWEFPKTDDGQIRKFICISSFNGIFEHIKPGSGFWSGYYWGGHVTSRSGNYRPIAWMELPPIDLPQSL